MPEQEQVPQALERFEFEAGDHPGDTWRMRKRGDGAFVRHADHLAIVAAIRKQTLAEVEEVLGKKFKANATHCREIASHEVDPVSHTLAVAAETWERAIDALDSPPPEPSGEECETCHGAGDGRLGMFAEFIPWDARHPKGSIQAHRCPDCEGTGKKASQSPDAPRCGGSGEEPDDFTRCGGEPTNPTFYGRDSEAELAGPDGYCCGCPDCNPSTEDASGDGSGWLDVLGAIAEGLRAHGQDAEARALEDAITFIDSRISPQEPSIEEGR